MAEHRIVKGVGRVLKIFILLFIFQNVQEVNTKNKECFKVIFNNNTWRDTCPDYCVNMTYNGDGSYSTVWHVGRDIPLPVSRFALKSYRKRNQDERTLYNITARLCELQNILNKVEMLKTATKSAFKLSNYTFKCPLLAGIYESKGFYISNRNPLLMLAYQQKSFFEVQGGLSEELPNGQLKELSAYFLKVRIVKAQCQKDNN